MNPKRPKGRISYLELPASDVARSADFYSRVFDWRQRNPGGDQPILDDAGGTVSISFIPERGPNNDAGALLYILVDNIAATCRAIKDNGGQIVQPIGVEGQNITARFVDPGGNAIDIYQNAMAVTRSGKSLEHAQFGVSTLVTMMLVVVAAACVLIAILWNYA